MSRRTSGRTRRSRAGWAKPLRVLTVLARLRKGALAVGALAAGTGSMIASGCTRPPVDDSPAAAAQLFAVRCAKCHGETGGADAPETASFEPRPRSFRDPAWQAAVDDAWLRQIIVGGGAAVGRSGVMPPNADLAHSPLLPALIRHLRSLQSTTGRPGP